jgi:hypothetical protein
MGPLASRSSAGPLRPKAHDGINGTYPGGLGQWMMEKHEAMMPFAVGYMGN